MPKTKPNRRPSYTPPVTRPRVGPGRCTFPEQRRDARYAIVAAANRNAMTKRFGIVYEMRHLHRAVHAVRRLRLVPDATLILAEFNPAPRKVKR